MMQIGRFEKVSFEQFQSAMKDEYGASPLVYNEESLRQMYDNIKLPTRSTSGSAGYDFKAPFDFALFPGDRIKVPTGVRVKISDGWFLGCMLRSSLGFKYRFQLNNTIGIIDSDYYDSDNEGHIFVKATNNGGKDIAVKAGDGFIQGIFLPYGCYSRG